MRVAIILNGISRKKDFFYQKILPSIHHAQEVHVFETQRPGHAIELSAQAADQHFDVVLAAGGDGTLNQVLNGVFQKERTTPPAIGIIPLGTGNDFARLLGLRAEGNQISNLLSNKSFHPIDVGELFCEDEQGTKVTRYFLNVCSLGMGPEVVRKLMKSSRAWGPTLTYFNAITHTFFTHQPQPVTIESEQWEWSGHARVVAVANGKSFGNGLFIAPDAQPDDGIFSTFVASDLPLFKFLFYLQSIKSKQKLRDPKILYNTCKSIHLHAPERTVLEAEGELQGYLPATIRVKPQAIRFLR